MANIFCSKDLRAKVEQKLFAKKPKISPINRHEGGSVFWSENWRKTAKLLPFFFSTNPKSLVSEKAKKNLKTKGVLVLVYPGLL